jgi:hypothetical protein
MHRLDLLIDESIVGPKLLYHPGRMDVCVKEIWKIVRGHGV